MAAVSAERRSRPGCEHNSPGIISAHSNILISQLYDDFLSAWPDHLDDSLRGLVERELNNDTGFVFGVDYGDGPHSYMVELGILKMCFSRDRKNRLSTAVINLELAACSALAIIHVGLSSLLSDFYKLIL